MRREPQWTEGDNDGRVVHVVGRMTDEVFSFLGPATATLARRGIDQALVMIDELRHRPHLAGLDPAIDLVLVPRVRNPVTQWQMVLKASRLAFARSPLRAIHLHGLLPCLAGAYAVRVAGVGAPIFYSPHGSRSLGKLRGIGALALWLFWPVLRPSRSSAIVNISQETRAFENWRSVDLVESPVADAFFAVPRNEARHPLIVTGGRNQNARNTELLAQLAVLLSGEDLRIGFNWIGTVDPVSQARLKAANVGVFDVSSDADCAARLAAGWIYVAPGGTRGFPLFLVEAMAAGLPCVAFDCAQHRAVILENDTGFLCASEREMMACIAALIDSPALRARIGEAAREQARRRFGEARFSAKLLAAYALPG
ncbi:MAG: hypothetical protein V7632_997 [Bradyrhizobium sp.]|jgi:glycosyltransferase involved in cell wall biosynthesis